MEKSAEKLKQLLADYSILESEVFKKFLILWVTPVFIVDQRVGSGSVPTGFRSREEE